MSKKNKKLMCAVYLSVDAPDKEIQEKEEKQFRYIKDYCKGNGLKIVKSYHRAGLSRCEMGDYAAGEMCILFEKIATLEGLFWRKSE